MKTQDDQYSDRYKIQPHKPNAALDTPGPGLRDIGFLNNINNIMHDWE